MNDHVPANHALADAAAQGAAGRGAVRPVLARALLDGCLALPDRAGRRGGAGSDDDVRAAMAIAREEGVPLLPRGGGTSQSGQTVGRALVIDFSRHLKRLVESTDRAHLHRRARHRARRAQPPARQSGLWFPVDVSTSSRATIGGMAGNNSCGTRSIRYGIMRDNVLAIDAILADGSEARSARSATTSRPCANGLPSPSCRRRVFDTTRGGVGGGGILRRRDSPHP